MARPRSGPESPLSGADTPFIKKGEIWVPGTDVLAPGAVVNNNNNEAKTGTIRIDFGGIGVGGAGGPAVAGVRPEVVAIPVVPGASGETPPPTVPPVEGVHDIEALTRQIEERLRGQYQEQLDQKVSELRAELDTQITGGNAKIEELSIRVTALETENEALATQNAVLEAENARLQAELDALQAQNLNPNRYPIMSNEEKVALMQQLVAARDDLAKYTIRRTGRITDRFLGRRKEDKRKYTAAKDTYTALLEQLNMADIQEGLDAGISEDELRRQMIEVGYDEHAAFAERRMVMNTEYWNTEAGRGGWRKWRANSFRRWANLDTKYKIAIGLTVGVAGGVATAGFGLGLFGLAAGAAARSSLGLLNHQTSIRNVTQKGLNKELSKIEKNRAEALRNIGSADLSTQARLTGRGFGTEHDSTVRHEMNRNRIGTVLMIGSGALAALGIADMAGADVPSIRGFWGAWNGHGSTTGATGHEGLTGNGGATGVTGTEGTTGAGGATGPTGTEGVTGNGGATGATGTEGSTGGSGASGATGATGTEGTTGSGGATGTEGSNGATDTGGNKEYYNPLYGNKSVGVEMPEGTHLLQNADGSYKIADNNGNAIIDRVGWDTQGNLDKATRAALRHDGFDLHQHKLFYTGTDGLQHQHYITDMENPDGITGTGQASTTTSSFNAGSSPSHTGIGGLHDLPLGGINAGSSPAHTGIGGLYDARPGYNGSGSTTLDGTHRQLIEPIEGQQYRDYLNPAGYHAAAADLPRGYHFGMNSLGGTNIYSPEGQVVIENVETTKTGALAPWVIEKLRAFPGLDVGDNHNLVFDATLKEPKLPGNTYKTVTSVLEEKP